MYSVWVSADSESRGRSKVPILNALVALVGVGNVDPGQWPGPLKVHDLSEEDANALVALLKEQEHRAVVVRIRQ